MSDEKTFRTECLAIMSLCRVGLNLPTESYIAVHYTADSLLCIFKYIDGKIYRLEVKEIQTNSPFLTEEGHD